MYDVERFKAVVDLDEIHRMAQSKNVEERIEAAYELFSNFTVISDKKQAWEDLHRLTFDGEDVVRENAGYALVGIFTIVPDKKQAWNDLIRLTQDGEINVGWGAADPLGRVFAYVHDKIQAQDDLHRLIQDDENFGRWEVAIALGGAFAYVPDKDQAWNDLQRLTKDELRSVRTFANYSLGKASIFKATEVENKEDIKRELETAIKFFEKSNEEVFLFEPARFCLPLYRSFYTIIFKNGEAEAEVQRYISEAKSTVEGSESREKLLEAVKNLENALKEARNLRDKDSNTVSSYLNAYRRYIERACELLETTEEKAPGATRLLKKGLPIIDERIKGIITEIQEKTKVVCRKTKGTAFEDLGKNVYHIGQNLQVNNPVLLEIYLNNMQISFSTLCAKTLNKKNTSDACELLKKVNEEQIFENIFKMWDEVLNKIILNLDNVTKIEVKDSKNIQITTAEGTTQEIVEIHEEKDLPQKSGVFNILNLSSIAATLSGFGTYIISETLDVIPVTENKHLVNAVLAVVVFFIIFIAMRKTMK